VDYQKGLMKKKCYGKPIPGMALDELRGSLIVLEGGDGVGRTTQLNLLKDWLERLGYPTVEVGLKRSELVGKELMEVMKGNMLCPITLSLFYITDFADQLENSLIPALRAGFVVIADRYIFTLMARHIARGVSKKWLTDITNFALVPDQIFYLKAKSQTLAERTFRKSGTLNFWESGMDIERSGDMFHCFNRYQRALTREFDEMARTYNFITVNADRDVFAIHGEIVNHVKQILKRPSIPAADLVERTSQPQQVHSRKKSGKGNSYKKSTPRRSK
jgi:dTMP kinase